MAVDLRYARLITPYPINAWLNEYEGHPIRTPELKPGCRSEKAGGGPRALTDRSRHETGPNGAAGRAVTKHGLSAGKSRSRNCDGSNPALSGSHCAGQNPIGTPV